MSTTPADRRAVLGNPRRVLVKIGSNVLTTSRGSLDRDRVHALADQVCALCDQGREVIVVSSGAIAAGVGELGLPKRPSTMPELQAAAAVGQGRLIQTYNEATGSLYQLCSADEGQEARLQEIHNEVAALMSAKRE